MARASASRDLDAAVVVLPLRALDVAGCLGIARDVGARGAAVVVVGSARETGEVTGPLERDGDVRCAAFTGSLDDPADRAALVEMISEIFAARDASPR